MAAATQKGEVVVSAIDKLGGSDAQIDLDDLKAEVGKTERRAARRSERSQSAAAAAAAAAASAVAEASDVHPSDTGVMTQSTTQARGKKYDIFLSHLQRNGQDAIIAMRMFLKQAHPGLRTFIDLEVDMKGDLTNTLKDAVVNCSAFLFFITDGILGSKWCAQELRWAVEFKKKIILVRETDERHGGLDMKNFFPQVPEDLMHVFQNIIAIPWYREPAFRDVSIRSILAAAQIEDTYAKDMAHLAKTRDKLEALIDVSGVTITAFDVISEYSWAMKLVFFIGGLTKYKNKKLDFIYSFIFGLSFWTCGAVCGINMVYQGVPYHIFSTDILTAYVHIPAWHSWLVWRKFVLTPHCSELLTKIMARPDYAAKIALACRVVGWLVLVLQVAMVSDVLLGFSFPHTIGERDAQSSGHMGYDNFIIAHSIVMYFVIPPVIASMFGSYCMFAFFSMLHLLDVEILKETMNDCANIAARFHSARRRAKDAALEEGAEAVSEVTSATGNSADGNKVEDLEQRQRKALMEDNLFEAVLDIISMLTFHTQRKIDRTCQSVNVLWMHLVLFSTMQVLAIFNGFISHTVGQFHTTYTWWWGLQDFFHLGGGIVLLIGAMCLFCVVTASFNMVPGRAQDLFEEARCPQVRQVQVVSRILSRKYGMHILFGQVYIGIPEVTAFFFVMTVFSIDYIMQIANYADAMNM